MLKTFAQMGCVLVAGIALANQSLATDPNSSTAAPRPEVSVVPVDPTPLPNAGPTGLTTHRLPPAPLVIDEFAPSEFSDGLVAHDVRLDLLMGLAADLPPGTTAYEKRECEADNQGIAHCTEYNCDSDDICIEDISYCVSPQSGEHYDC